MSNTVLSKNLAAAKAGGPVVPPAGPVTVNGAIPAARPAARPAPKAPAKKVDARKFFVLSPETNEPFPSELTAEEVNKLIQDLSADLQLNESGSQEWKAASEWGGFEVALAMIGGTVPETPAAAPATPPQAPATPTKIAPPAGQRTAPWWNEKCTACVANTIRGFNSKGGICRICEGFFGQAITNVYEITTNDNKIDWHERPATDKPATGGAPAGAQAANDETGGETSDGASGSTEISSAVGASRRGRGRPPKGFTLLVGVSCSKGFPGAVQLDDFLTHYGKKLAETSGVESYYDLDAFSRRDKIAREAPRIAQELGTAFVFVRNASDPEVRSLLVALAPLASTILEAAK